MTTPGSGKINVWLPYKKDSSGGEQGVPWKEVLLTIVGAPQWNQQKSENTDEQCPQHGEKFPQLEESCNNPDTAQASVFKPAFHPETPSSIAPH